MKAPDHSQGEYRRAQPEGTAAGVGANPALLGIGHVMHARLRPRRHRFVYPTYFLMLPMRSLRNSPAPDLARNRFGLIAFRDADHGDGHDDSLAWLEELLAREGVHDARGEIWLQCYPRVLGFAFKPVSFWYCLREDGTLAALVAEVNNTFGERHCYLLRGGAGPGDGPGNMSLRCALAEVPKRFHVSPFCEVAGSYRFRFDWTGWHCADSGAQRARMCVDYFDAAGELVLKTSLSGGLQPLTRRAQWRAFWRMPWMSLAVWLRIHWQALKLLRAGVPWFRKPQAPVRGLGR